MKSVELLWLKMFADHYSKDLSIFLFLFFSLRLMYKEILKLLITRHTLKNACVFKSNKHFLKCILKADLR